MTLLTSQSHPLALTSFLATEGLHKRTQTHHRRHTVSLSPRTQPIREETGDVSAHPHVHPHEKKGQRSIYILNVRQKVHVVICLFDASPTVNRSVCACAVGKHLHKSQQDTECQHQSVIVRLGCLPTDYILPIPKANRLPACVQRPYGFSQLVHCFHKRHQGGICEPPITQSPFFHRRHLESELPPLSIAPPRF